MERSIETLVEIDHGTGYQDPVVLFLRCEKIGLPASKKFEKPNH